MLLHVCVCAASERGEGRGADVGRRGQRRRQRGGPAVHRREDLPDGRDRTADAARPEASHGTTVAEVRSEWRRRRRHSPKWSAVAGWLASRTLDPRVVRSNPSVSVTCARVPGQNTLPLIARVFSDRTLKIVGPFYLVSVPGEVKDLTRVI